MHISAKSLIVIARLSTDKKDRPIAIKTLLLASSEWSMTFGGGKTGKVGVCASDPRALILEKSLNFLCGAEESGDWRRRAEGLIFLRVRVP
jgi:hypothetical protein